jgi:5'-nucleotidase
MGRKDADLKGNTDRYHLSEGFATLTPLSYDFTNFHLMEKVRQCMEEDSKCE